MLEWDSRMQDNHSVQVLKAVIPFFDIAIGETVDMEGLLGAVRPFASDGERKIIDMILQLFQMRRMMSMMQMMRTMQAAQDAAQGTESGGFSPDMFDMLKTALPPEQQETIDMAAAMMSMMQMGEGDSSEPEPEEEAREEGQNESVDF